jgi:uncharacterized protein (DUF2141 family)
MPSGGDKDLTPPQIIFSSPQPMSTGFNARRIEIEFDEFVRLQGVRDQVLISPPLDQAPLIEMRGGKRLLVDFGDEVLRENTTYTINFGDAITDNNEGNPLEQNVYLFSTGDYIDTLSLQGQLLRARYNSPCESCLAMLFPDVHDSLVLGQRPFYVARSDADGYFKMRNLADGTYRLFALDDLDADLRIDANEVMAFQEAPVRPMANDSLALSMRLFSPPISFVGIKEQTWSDDGRVLNLVTVGLDSMPKVLPPAAERLLYLEQIEGKSDSLRYWFGQSLEDLDYLLLEFDGQIDTLNAGRSKNTETMPPQVLNAALKHIDAPLQLNLERPLADFDTGLIRLEKDSLPISWSIKEEQSSVLKLELAAAWEEGAYYSLSVLPGAIEDIYGLSCDSLLTRFRCPEERTFGTLTLDINLDQVEAQYHMELLDKSKKVVRTALTMGGSQKWTSNHLKPGDYTLRVYIDENADGKWTSGAFDEKRQPEPVFMLSQAISVRANWELEQEVIVTFE